VPPQPRRAFPGAISILAEKDSMKGFLGAGATFAADLNLLVQLAMGLALVAGAFLARRERYRAHGICQSAGLLLNLVMIALVMSPSFHRQVRPQLRAGLRDPYYAVATAHAALGTAAELLGLYIILVAGTNLLPRRLRFERWKPWMRAELALWWIVVLFGAATYAVWYVAPQGAAAPRPAKASAGRVVEVSDFSFTAKQVSVPAGSTVEWVDVTGRHSVEADDGSFKSPTMISGQLTPSTGRACSPTTAASMAPRAAKTWPASSK